MPTHAATIAELLNIPAGPDVVIRDVVAFRLPDPDFPTSWGNASRRFGVGDLPSFPPGDLYKEYYLELADGWHMVLQWSYSARCWYERHPIAKDLTQLNQTIFTHWSVRSLPVPDVIYHFSPRTP